MLFSSVTQVSVSVYLERIPRIFNLYQCLAKLNK